MNTLYTLKDTMMVCAAMQIVSACGVAVALEDTVPETVQAVVVKEILIPDIVAGFGSLAFSKKVDVSSPQDAVIKALACREGDSVRAGAVVALLENPQLALAVGRAENGVLQAESAHSLAKARLFEGELAAEAKLLGIEKADLELRQSLRELAEAERKQEDQETLFNAGGVTQEAIRSSRFSIRTAAERIVSMEKDIEIQRVGMRDQDLENRGLCVPEDAAERKQALVHASVATLEAECSAAQARLEAARKELQSARLSVEELVVRAPISGVVAARYLEAGERVKREDKLFTVIDVLSLYAIASVFESEALRVAAGMDARVTVDGVSSSGLPEDYAGVVDRVSPVADVGSASFSVRIVLNDPSRQLRPGMFAQSVITVGEARKVIVVPESAIAEKNGQAGNLFFISAGIVSLRRVSFGSLLEEGREVLSGASPGDVIVDKPDMTLKEGHRVSISK